MATSCPHELIKQIRGVIDVEALWCTLHHGEDPAFVLVDVVVDDKDVKTPEARNNVRKETQDILHRLGFKASVEVKDPIHDSLGWQPTPEERDDILRAQLTPEEYDQHVRAQLEADE